MSVLYIFMAALRDLTRVKRLVTAAVAMLTPAVIAVVWRVAAPTGYDPVVIYNVLASGVLFGFMLVILSVVFGTGVISQEVEQKTIPYLLTRPVPRWRILAAKFAAAVIGITLTLWAGAVLLAAATFLPGPLPVDRLLTDLGVLPIGALAYAALFVLLATLLNRPLMYGLFFAFGWESWVPSLPGTFGRVSVMTYLRVLAPHPTPQGESRAITELLNTLTPEVITRSTAWWALGGTIAIAAVVAALVFTFGEYSPREDAE